MEACRETAAAAAATNVALGAALKLAREDERMVT